MTTEKVPSFLNPFWSSVSILCLIYVTRLLDLVCLLVNFKKRLADTVTHNDRSTLYEELGDLACTAELFELGFSYYQEMLQHSENDSNKERICLACSSIIETARNLHNYGLAQRHQIQALNLIRDLHSEDRDKVCELS